MKRASPIVIVCLMAILSGWPTPGSELTAPAAAVFAPDAASNAVTDGVAVWRDWMPLSGSWGMGSTAGERGLQWALWLGLLLSVFSLAVRLTRRPWAALVAPAWVAFHPLGLALHADLAGRGLLVAALFMTLGWRLSLSAEPGQRPSRRTLLGIGACTLLGALGSPIALLFPVMMVLFVWLAPAPQRPRLPHAALLWSGVPALGVIVARWAMGLPDGVELGGHEAVGAADEVPPVTGLLLVGRTLAGLAPSTRVLRQPCEATFVDLGASEPMVWLGAIALVGLPMVTRRISDPVASSGLWWLWAILVASSQIAEPLPSALSPALGAVASIGLAVALTALAVSRNAQIALLAMALLMGGVSTIQARTSLKGELDALEAGVEQCPTSAAPLVRLARYYVAQGQATRALELLDGVEGDTAAGLRVELFLARGSWGRARREVSLLTGDSALEWQCRTGALMREVSAVRSCVAAREALGDERELVAAHAQALQRDRRTAEAEALLREQLAARPADPVLNEGLASLLEQASWMRQAVEALEAWYVLDNSQYVLKRLVSALVRKGKGDLVGGRATEARKAFERALVLAPDEHEVRYHLARALEDGGDLAGAKRERARAASAGAKPPVSPLQMRGMPPLDER